VRTSGLLTIAWVLLISACYQQPVISPQRPLRCTPSETKSECPKGFTCAASGVCAASSCQKTEDCPAGLACTSRGCVLVPDGGLGDAPPIQIPVPPDGAPRIDVLPPPDFGAPAPDLGAPAPDVATPTFDGGNA
jgi:hypothetical protein